MDWKVIRKTQGAISIFLVIILVPMMTISSLMVDAGKIKMGKAVAASAGDLALNTGLTAYDTKLKEMYGLIATAQDTQDLFDKMEDYYRTCIISSGVSYEDAHTYTEQIMADLGIIAESNDVSDIMQMQLIDFSVEKLSNSDLAKAAMLERQTVEFMKYRAPINTGMRFVSALKSFKSLKKQTELVDKRQEYYKAEQTLMEDLKAAWDNICLYENTYIGNPVNKSFLEDVKRNMEMFEEGGKYYGSVKLNLSRIDMLEGWQIKGYKDIHKYLVKDTYKVKKTWGSNQYDYIEYSAEIKQEDCIYLGPDGEETEYQGYIFFPGTGLYKLDNFSEYCEQYNKNNLPSLEDVQKSISLIHQYYGKADGYYSELDRTDDGNYHLQVLVQSMRGALDQLNSVESEAYTEVQKLKAMMIWIDALENPDDILNASYKTVNYKSRNEEKTIKEWYEEIDNIVTKGLYQQHMEKYKEVAEKFKGYSTESKSIYDNSSALEGSALIDISRIASEYKSNLTTAQEKLVAAMGALSAAKEKLEDGGTVKEAKDSWNNTAQDSQISDTSMAKQDKAEIDQLDKYLNVENIKKLYDRLDKVQQNIGKLITQIDAFKYCNTFIGDIKDHEKLEEVAAAAIGDGNLLRVPRNENELDNQANTWWSSHWSSGTIEIDWRNQSGTQPILTDDQLALYSYMYTKFGKDTSVELEKEEGHVTNSDYKSIKKQSKNSADNQKSSATPASETKTTDTGDKTIKDANNINAKEGLPSKSGVSTNSGMEGTDTKDTDADSAAKNSSSALDKMFSGEFASAINELGTDLRDKLYVSDYVLSMFSYDTIENEYKVKNKVTSIKDGDLETLTRQPINPANNFAYGCEVEYIVFADSNSGNLTKSYASIYAIRLGFNVIYAFATSEIRETALAMALPISAATLGIIPAPLIQAVIIVGMACIESAIDLCDLKDGKAVPLFKSKDSWRCSISGLAKQAVARAGEMVAGYVIDESLETFNSLLDMTEEELNEAIRDGGGQLQETVEEKYNEIITQNVNSVVQQLTNTVKNAVESTFCIDQSIGETYESKKAEMKSWIKDQMKLVAANSTGSDIASKAKKMAAEYVVNNGDALIDKLFDAMEKTMKSGASDNTGIGSIVNTDFVLGDKNPAEEIDAIGGEVMSVVTEIRKGITSAIMKGTNELTGMVSSFKEKISDAAQKGAENLKSTLHEQVGQLCGTGGSDSGNALASLASFSYSDYLRLFLLISLYANEEATMLRIADVIQVNIAHQTGNTEYRLANSACYIKVNAEMIVKPTLIALPLFADTTKEARSKGNWYTLQYEGYAGY